MTEKQKNEHALKSECDERKTVTHAFGLSTTPFSFTRGDTLRPTYGAPYFQICCCQVNAVRPASSLEVPLDSTSPRTPLIEWRFMSSPMVPLWVVQLLPTSPGDPTSRCDQNESHGRFRRLVPIQRDRGVQRMRYMGFIAKMFKCIGSK